MKRQLKTGDTICVQGIKVTIDKILYQEPWKWREAWHIEFLDSNGDYHFWRQESEGGTAFDENGNEIAAE